MKKVQTIVVLCSMLLIAGIASAADTFVIGIAPHTSARVIFEMYRPLASYLEEKLGMPVEMITAPDFDTFARRGLAQEFDLAITTGHQARLFQNDAGYLPLLTYKADFKAVAIVSVSGGIRKPTDLSGKDVLGLSPTSLVSLWGQHWLLDNKAGNNPMKYVSASDSVAQLVASGDAAMGFTSLANYQKLSHELRVKLRILAESKPMAGRVYLVNSRRAALHKKLNTALWSFAKTPEAWKYFKSNNLNGYRKLRPNELSEMDSYAAEVRKVIATPK